MDIESKCVFRVCCRPLCPIQPPKQTNKKKEGREKNSWHQTGSVLVANSPFGAHGLSLVRLPKSTCKFQQGHDSEFTKGKKTAGRAKKPARLVKSRGKVYRLARMRWHAFALRVRLAGLFRRQKSVPTTSTAWGVVGFTPVRQTRLFFSRGFGEDDGEKVRLFLYSARKKNMGWTCPRFGVGHLAS